MKHYFESSEFRKAKIKLASRTLFETFSNSKNWGA